MNQRKKIVGRFFCALLIFLNDVTRAQDIFFEDSLLWSSPVSAKTVSRYKIKKITVREKGWVQVCKNCPDHPEVSMLKDVYRKNITTFRYDTLGFPFKINRSNYRQRNKNKYDSAGQLIESEAYFKADKSKLYPTIKNIREYNSSDFLRRSIIYYRNELLRINEYQYSSSGKLIEIIEKRTNISKQNDKSAETYMTTKFEYDKNNMLYRKSELTPRSNPAAPFNNRSFYFYHDSANNDSSVVQICNNDTVSVSNSSESSPKGKIVILKLYFPTPHKEFRAFVETTEKKVYHWDFVYDVDHVWPRCRIYDIKTGLLLEEIKETLANERPKLRIEENIIGPENLYKYQFSAKATITTYKYSYRD